MNYMHPINDAGGEIGVRVTGEFIHPDTGENVVEVQFRLPTLAASTTGRIVPSNASLISTKEALQAVISHCDRLLAELRTARNALARNLRAIAPDEYAPGALAEVLYAPVSDPVLWAAHGTATNSPCLVTVETGIQDLENAGVRSSSQDDVLRILRQAAQAGAGEVLFYADDSEDSTG